MIGNFVEVCSSKLVRRRVEFDEINIWRGGGELDNYESRKLSISLIINWNIKNNTIIYTLFFKLCCSKNCTKSFQCCIFQLHKRRNINKIIIFLPEFLFIYYFYGFLQNRALCSTCSWNSSLPNPYQVWLYVEGVISSYNTRTYSRAIKEFSINF